MENDNEDIKASISYARNVARKVVQEAKFSKPPILIDEVVQHLIEKGYDISVHAWKFEETVSGIQLAGNSNSCAIGYNEDHHTHRQRFTVAHEIGHFLLGHTHETDPEKFKPSEVQEQEAHEFAGELLMPLAMLNTAIKSGTKTIASLAKLFLVSEDAMTMRLMKTKLLNKLMK